MLLSNVQLAFISKLQDPIFPQSRMELLWPRLPWWLHLMISKKQLTRMELSLLSSCISPLWATKQAVGVSGFIFITLPEQFRSREAMSCQTTREQQPGSSKVLYWWNSMILPRPKSLLSTISTMLSSRWIMFLLVFHPQIILMFAKPASWSLIPSQNHHVVLPAQNSSTRPNVTEITPGPVKPHLYPNNHRSLHHLVCHLTLGFPDLYQPTLPKPSPVLQTLHQLFPLSKA